MKTKVYVHMDKDNKINGYAFLVKPQDGLYNIKAYTGATYLNKPLIYVENLLDSVWEYYISVEIPNMRDFEYAILMKHFWELDKWLANMEMPHIN